MTRKFWSEKEAEEFAERLELHGDIEFVDIWQEQDRLNNCTVYIVEWYE